MTEIVYSREVVALSDGQVFQNPRFFAGPIAGADSVVVHGDWPDIVAAYVAAGVEVRVIGGAAAVTVHEPAPGDFGERADAFIAAQGFASGETVVLSAGAGGASSDLIGRGGGGAQGGNRKPK